MNTHPTTTRLRRLRTHRRLAALTAGVLSAGALLAAGAGTAAAAPGNTTFSCTIPQSVVCKISDPDGIARVTIIDGRFKPPLTVVNKTYRNCPQNVTVSWDSNYQPTRDIVTDCAGKLRPGMLTQPREGLQGAPTLRVAF